MKEKQIINAYKEYKKTVLEENRRIKEQNTKRIDKGQPAMYKPREILCYDDYKILYEESIKELGW